MNRVLSLQKMNFGGSTIEEPTSSVSAGLCSSVSGGLCSSVSAGLCDVSA